MSETTTGRAPTGPDVFFGLEGVYVPRGSHIAHFFRGEAERFAVLAPYFKAGLEAGDHCVCLAEDPQIRDLRRHLGHLGVDAERAWRDGQLVGFGGAARAAALAEVFDSLVVSARAAGRTLVRIGGDMTWALGRMQSTADIAEWEAFYDANFGSRIDYVALCQYDHTRFDGRAVMWALETHPVCVIGSVIQENPFHRDPREVLADIRK